MVLRSLRLISFRAHARTECEFAPSVNLIHGPNGAGKTNMLDAIHYLCLTKGFVASQDRYIVRRGDRHTEIEGNFERDDGRAVRVRMAYVPGEGKRTFLNGVPLEKLSEIVGMLPVVVYSPQDHVLTAGGPEERRRFMDNILSQARPLYLDTLIKYRRALRQRNVLLLKLQGSGSSSAVLSSWDHELIHLGSRIVAARALFVEEFAGYLERAYREVEAVAERPTMSYDASVPASPGADAAAVAEVFGTRLEESRPDERRRGLTLVGPHRDELSFRLDGLLVRRYASQGQHRTFGMAMKLAKYFYLREQTGERPLLLLDDVFDHLDRRRSRAFLELLESDRVGQTLITATDVRPFSEIIDFASPEHRDISVDAGAVVS